MKLSDVQGHLLVPVRAPLSKAIASKQMCSVIVIVGVLGCCCAEGICSVCIHLPQSRRCLSRSWHPYPASLPCARILSWWKSYPSAATSATVQAYSSFVHALQRAVGAFGLLLDWPPQFRRFKRTVDPTACSYVIRHASVREYSSVHRCTQSRRSRWTLLSIHLFAVR
jgi:hypothetical protein